MMAEQEKWKWQESGSSWKGIGIYHVTLTITSREPLLGRLVIPDNDPTQARVERTELGRVLLDCLRSVPVFHPEIQVLQYSLMPDHLHSIWYVRRPMEKSIRYVAQGFWRAAKKAGRAYDYLQCRLSGEATDEKNRRLSGEATDGRETLETGGTPSLSSIAQADSLENLLLQLLGGDTYCNLAPLFTEPPFIRPMSRRGQLQAMIHYVQLNPQRLATKRLMPGFFRVQEGITIANRTYAGVGNVILLQAARYAPVHVRHELVGEATHGNNQPLRNYMNGCVLAAREGTVMVSPFISPYEKQVMQVLLREERPFIYLADNGFRDYYKPIDILFDACASGRVLILSPWAYDANKRHISRAECVALNTMAEEICNHLSGCACG